MSKNVLRPLTPKDQLALNSAILLHQSGSIDKAKDIYLTLLKKNPVNVDLNYLLGAVAIQQKEWQTAIGLLGKAINVNPGNPAFYYNRGLAHYGMQNLEAAIQDYGLAIAKKPDYIEAYLNRGVAEQEMLLFEAAIESYDKAIALNPRNISAYSNRSVALCKLLRFEESIASCEIAIALSPGFAEAHFNRGNALQELKRFDAAVLSYQTAIDLNPRYAKAHLNLGVCRLKLKQYEAALLSLQSALQLNPDYPEAHLNLGDLFREVRQFDLALASLDNAAAVKPGYGEAHFNKALVQLALGHFESGWPLYEWRWKSEATPSKPLLSSKPVFSGHGSGKRVLVWAEQGVGDEIMFASLLNCFGHLCPKLLAAVDVRLLPLFRRSFRHIEFYDRACVVPEDLYDEHLAMGGMCQYLMPSSPDFSLKAPAYLLADKHRSTALRASFGIDSGSRLCGISWRTTNQNFASRNLQLKALMSSLAAPDLRFVSLQYGDTQKEIDNLAVELGISVLSCRDVDNFRDIDGLAALIDACDVVVSIDNTTVHLAGALGKPVHVLLPFDSDWRWMTDGDLSYWYASARLFRQGSDWNWTPLLEQVRKEIA